MFGEECCMHKFCVCKYVCLCCSGATRGCVWRMGLVQRAWTGAGVCGHPGRSAAGPAEEECPLLSDTATAPGKGLNFEQCKNALVLLFNTADNFSLVGLIESITVVAPNQRQFITFQDSY